MNRQQKVELVGNLRQSFAQGEAFLVNYRGMSVADLQQLRRALRGVGGTMQVAKPRLLKLAVQDLDGISALKPYLKDQLAVVFVTPKASLQVVKALSDFSKGRETFAVLAGYFDARLFNHQELQVVAKLPPREVLLAQVCGTLNAPISSLARVLSLQMTQLLYTLQQVADKKQQ